MKVGVSYIELDKLPSQEILASVEDRCNQVILSSKDVLYMMIFTRLVMVMTMMVMMMMALGMVVMILVIVSDIWNQMSRMSLEVGSFEKYNQSIIHFQR